MINRTHALPVVRTPDPGADPFHISRIQISMDGTGCWRDNVFVERLWKSVKYEEVYQHAYEKLSAQPNRDWSDT
jgi:hypothetical protein